MTKESNIFSTRDLCLAATLVTLGYFMVGVDYQIEGIKSTPVGYFKFEDSKELAEIKTKYTNGQLTVEPRTFLNNMHSLKAEVNNIYKNPQSEWNKN